MKDTFDTDNEILQKLVDTIAKLNLRIRGSIRTANADYELETYYDAVVVEDADGNEIVSSEIETHDG